MNAIGNMKRSPKFIRAKNEEELQKKILLLQLQHACEYRWLTIYPTKGGLVGWYYDISDIPEKLRLLNG